MFIRRNPAIGILVTGILLIGVGLGGVPATVDCAGIQRDSARIDCFHGSRSVTLALMSAGRTNAAPVQLFDVVRGEVIRDLPNSAVYRHKAEAWIASIRGAWGGFRLDPTSGYVLKVPLEPPLNVNNGWYRGEVTELYVMWDPAAPHDTRLMLMGRGVSPRIFVVGAEAGAFVESVR